MNPRVIILFLLVLLALSSCRTINKLTGKDHSGNTAVTKKNSSGNKREFLDGIEVTPGNAVGSKQTSTVANKPAEKKNNVNIQSKNGFWTGSIENANMLQLKYAIATDATVEKLTNIPLLEVIDKWWGTRYCLGGSTDNCIDCSAFTQLVMKEVYHQSLPRTSQEQYAACEKIDLEDLHEGDLVFFNTGGKDISHVGLYLLNNKFVHAATSGGVMISDLNDKYWQPKFVAAGRVGTRGN